MKDKLNIGSGCMLLPDYINFDVVRVIRGGRSTDVVGVAQDILQHFEHESFNEILCCHILEHLRPNDGKKLIQDCYKLLRKDGVLVVECPDVLKCISLWNDKNSTFGSPPSVHKLMTFLYGWNKDQWRDYGYHQYGYTVDTMSELMILCKFKIIKKCDGMLHGRRARDFRIEGKK
jgi:predicted SAM-dependent methyltransferase